MHIFKSMRRNPSLASLSEHLSLLDNSILCSKLSSFISIVNSGIVNSCSNTFALINIRENTNQIRHTCSKSKKNTFILCISSSDIFTQPIWSIPDQQVPTNNQLSSIICEFFAQLTNRPTAKNQQNPLNLLLKEFAKAYPQQVASTFDRMNNNP